MSRDTVTTSEDCGLGFDYVVEAGACLLGVPTADWMGNSRCELNAIHMINLVWQKQETWNTYTGWASAGVSVRSAIAL